MNKAKEKDNNKVQRLDIRGKVCPLTFVYTKLTLEKMKSGEILEVELDFPAALENVPASCERQNIGELLDVKEIESEKKVWILTIKKI
ncbi:MAG: sulfurtransferase TusA family protein [Promethearchaeota archaeon]